MNGRALLHQGMTLESDMRDTETIWKVLALGLGIVCLTMVVADLGV